MPSSEALAPIWITLLDRHLGVAIADGLTFTPAASTHHKLLWTSRCTPGAIARQFSRIQGHLPHLGPKRQGKHRGAIGVPSGGFQRSLTAS